MNEWTRQELEKDIIGRLKGITIAINVRLEGEHRILDFSEV